MLEFAEPKEVKEVIAMCIKCRRALRISESAAEKWKKCGICGTDFVIMGAA